MTYGQKVTLKTRGLSVFIFQVSDFFWTQPENAVLRLSSKRRIKEAKLEYLFYVIEWYIGALKIGF